MPDHIRYDLLTQQALRGVVRNVLVDAAKKGLPGEHHFYISFDTRAEGVRLSERLRAQYPEQMTVILQHQFWDLTITDTGFEVGLSFGGIPEKLGVPFDSIKGFFDPSVQFGLQFEEAGEVPGEQAEEPQAAKQTAKPTPVAPPSAAPAPAAPAAAAAEKPKEKPETKEKPEVSGAEVVSLDRFRKK